MKHTICQLRAALETQTAQRNCALAGYHPCRRWQRHQNGATNAGCSGRQARGPALSLPRLGSRDIVVGDKACSTVLAFT